MKPEPGRKNPEKFWCSGVRKRTEILPKENQVVKIERADGGNLGTQRRRRTWRPTINPGELEASHEPGVSEWGNPKTAH